MTVLSFGPYHLPVKTFDEGRTVSEQSYPPIKKKQNKHNKPQKTITMAPLWTDFSAFWAPRAASVPLGQRVPPLRSLRSLRLKSHVALPSYGFCRCGLQPFHNRSSTNSSYLGLFNEARFSQIFLEDILGFIECSSWVYP